MDRVTDLNASTHQGIDGVYFNPDGHPPYIIGEAKYGSSRLSTLSDGTKQMSKSWIDDRIIHAVSKNVYDDILLNGYKSNLVNIDAQGNVVVHQLNDSAKIIR